MLECKKVIKAIASHPDDFRWCLSSDNQKYKLIFNIYYSKRIFKLLFRSFLLFYTVMTQILQILLLIKARGVEMGTWSQV